MTDDRSPQPGGNEEPIAIPMPMPPSLARLIEHAARHDDHHAILRDAEMARVDAFIDGLTVDQAMALRTILNMDQKSPIAQFFDGRVYALLRYVHHVDPDSGKTHEQELAEAAAREHAVRTTIRVLAASIVLGLGLAVAYVWTGVGVLGAGSGLLAGVACYCCGVIMSERPRT